MQVTWKNISVTRGNRSVLNKVSGHVSSNKFIGVLGPSGSGKTTLLHTLAGILKPITGTVLLGGVSPRLHTSNIAYLQQSDAFLEFLTVLEHLEFQARLYLHHIQESDLRTLLEETLSRFGLSHCSDIVIGSPYRHRGGISGGERRRLAIASQCIRNPKLLILDEPTSGLDSHSAHRLLECLQEIRSQMTIILTIHQPSHSYLQAFNRILILDKGKTVYWGPSDPSAMIRELSPLGIIPLEEGSTAYPTDTLMRVLAEDPEATSLLEKTYAGQAGQAGQASIPLPTPPRACVGFSTLVRRNWLDNWRNPQVVRARLGQSIVLSVIAISLFGGDADNQSAVQDRTGLLFFLGMDAGFGSSFNALKTFARHLVVFRREYRAGAYGVTNYFVSKIIADVPFQLFFPLVVFVPVFWISRPDSSMSTFWLAAATHTLVAQAGCSLGYFLSSLCGSMEVAIILNPTILLPMMLTGGLYLKASSIPSSVAWMGEMSFFRYGFHNQMLLAWKNRTLRCDPGETCLFHTGEEVLDYFSLSDKDFGRNCLILGGIILGLRLLALLALVWRTRQFR